jgi:hypothetical protein
MPYIAGSLVVASAVLAYHLFRLVYPRRPRFEVSAVSEYWLQQQRGTSGDTY